MAQYEREDDHDAAAADRLPRRLRMPNLQSLLAIFVERWQRIENVAWQLYTERTIDTAEGVQLEQLGKKAGYWPRNFVSADGSEDDDEVYRARVKAKFIANRSSGLEPEIGAVFDALALPGITYSYEPGFPAGFIWRAIEVITPVQARICLRFLAWSKPAGVRALFAWQETEDEDAFYTDNTVYVSAGLPAFQAGTGITAGTGDVTRVWPAHATGDIGILCVQSANEAVTLATPAGFVEIASGSPQGVGTAGAAGACRLTVFWCRATSGAMTDPIVQDPGDHAIVSLFTVRGCVASGDPVHLADGATGTGTAVSIPGGTTTEDDCLIVAIAAHGIDVAAAQFSAWADAALGSITEHSDAGSTTNHGGGIAYTTGTLATAGAFGPVTATVASTNWAGIVLALLPELTGTPGTGLGLDDIDAPGGGGALTGIREAI